MRVLLYGKSMGSFVIPCTVAYQSPLSIEFSRKECWDARMLECSSPGDLSSPGIEPVPLVSAALAGRFFTTVPPGMPIRWELLCRNVRVFFSVRLSSELGYFPQSKTLTLDIQMETKDLGAVVVCVCVCVCVCMCVCAFACQ